MVETFKREAAATPMDFSGERLTSAISGEVAVEHYHRYFLARDFCDGLDVLDIAAGEGYGSAILAQVARSVVGVEIDPAVVDAANTEFVRSNLRYIQGDARAIPLPDASIDVAVSFETFEHFGEHELFLAELRRVLRPNGLLIISTPDRDIYSGPDIPPNPFHVREVNRPEFESALSAHFGNVRIASQRSLVGSFIEGDQEGLPTRHFEARGGDQIEAGETMARAPYLIAFASEAALPSPPRSLYVYRSDFEMDAQARQLIAQAQLQNQQLHAATTTLEAELQATLGREAELHRTAKELETQLAAAVAAFGSVQQELERLRASLSWRATAPLRSIMTRYPGLARRLRQGAKLAYWTVTGQLPRRLRASIAYRTSPPSADIAAPVSELEGLSPAHDRLAASLSGRAGSTFWQVKGPIRAALAKRPTIQRLARRTAKVLWWTVTLQLPQRLADRRRVLASQTARKVPKSRTNSQDLKKQAVDIATRDLTDFLNSDEIIAFPSYEKPEISILIVVWNKAYFTLRCLRALHSVSSKIEIVLVDNASTDETTDMLSRIDGIHVIVSDVNEGFLTATNRAAGVARGQAYLLLNNDAFVRPGAIEAAFATLNEEPNAGAVGGRLILPDGSLQEAGSIIWSDGSTQGYGRGIEPDAGEAMFRRDVDYCSGAFLMTPAAVWKELNGFDTVYAPAYYEEVDYCMRVAEIGLRTIYEPEAAVDHFEFGSETKRGDTLELVLRNRKQFISRHASELGKKHLSPSPDHILLARRSAASRARCLLVVDDLVPLASLGSGLPRTKAILRTASDLGWNVVFYPLSRTDIEWSATWLEIPKNVEIILDGAPGFADFMVARQGYFDTALVSRPHNMAFVSAHLRGGVAKDSDVRLIYDAEALFALREILRAEVAGTPLPAEEAQLMVSSELAICDNADAIICVTEAEASIFRNRLSEPHRPPVGVLSFPTEQKEGAPGFEAREGFLFIGRLLETASPNWDGMMWFLRECWPHVRRALPGATLTVVGHVHPAHEQLDAPGVRFIGPLDDLETAYDAARVFLAPVRFAAGIPIKILEATAAGVPTVGTRLMARQMNFEPGREIMAEDEPIAFAEAAVALHGDRGTWLEMRNAAQRRIQAEHSAARFRSSLAEILDERESAPEMEKNR